MIGTVKQIIGSIKYGVTAQKLQKINLRVIGLTFVIIGITVPLLSAQQHKKKLNEFLTLYELSGMQNSDAAEDLQQLIEVHLENASLEQALVAIADKADLKLMYSKSLLPEEGRITLSEQSITLYDALWKILDETGLRFALSQNHQLVLLKKQNKKLETVQETITGEVTDAQTGETLPGVNILVKGTSTGASTDASGQYELTVESLQDTLVVSFVGYKTKQVPINGRTEVNVALQTQAISGEEMVVVGYGTQKRSQLTKSVSSVSSDEIEGNASTSFDQALQGRVAGMSITQGSSALGGGTEIRIRGNNSILGDNRRLYVIDGVPVNSDNITTPGTGTQGVAAASQNPLSSINPDAIKSIEILKDASATAIYAFAQQRAEMMLENMNEEKDKSSTNAALVSLRTFTKDGKLKLVQPKDWTSGFFPGELWYLYQYSNDQHILSQAKRLTGKLEQQNFDDHSHDVGFKVYNSYGNGYRLTKDPSYKNVVIQAAKTLSTCFSPAVGAIRSWDFIKDEWSYPVIIDNMMNLELLFSATKLSGDSTYYNIAVQHANTTMKNHFRSDYSSWHVVDYDPQTGKVQEK